MKILDFFKNNREIMVLDYDFVIHFIRISDMYKWLIDTNGLTCTYMVDGVEQKHEITFNEWWNDKVLTSIDLTNYLKQKNKQHDTK